MDQQQISLVLLYQNCDACLCLGKLYISLLELLVTKIYQHHIMEMIQLDTQTRFQVATHIPQP